MLNETTQLVATAINVLLALFCIVFVISSLTLLVCRVHHRDRPRLINLCWYWTKWPALAFILTDPVLTCLIDGHLGTYRILTDALGFLTWWLYRNDGDDDDHKRLKKKVKDTVRIIRGRLVVTPQPA